MRGPRLQLIPKDSVQTKQTIKNTIINTTVSLLIFAAVFMTTTTSEQPLDDVFFTMNTPSNIVVCGNAEIFEIEYINTSGYTLTGQEISISLPDGISYIPGSIINTSGNQVVEDDISDLSNVIFTLNDLDDGGTVQFTIEYIADLDAVTWLISGNTPRNTVSLTTNEGVNSQNSQAYNILYASLNITNVNPTSQSISSGDTTTRTFTITNAGNGRLSSFILTDSHTAGIDIISSNVGTLNANRDTIFLNSSDFTSIGNGDGYFDTNESLNLTETIVATGCTDATISSVIKAEWGCSGSTLTNASTNAHVTVNLKLPSLSISSSSTLESCFGSGVPNAQQINLKNNGQGVATQVAVDIYKSTGGVYNQDIYSAIDTSSITWQIGTGGNPSHISPLSVTNTQSSGAYSCLGSNPIGQVTLSIPNINAGEEIIIKWNTISCCVNPCNNEVNTGWKYNVSYNDVCEQNPSSTTKTGDSPKSASMSIFSESPSDIRNGQKEEFIYTISSYQNQYPAGTGAHFEVVFDIPEGLSWSGNNDDLSFVGGNSTWTPFSVSFDNGQHKLTAKYLMPEAFSLPKSEIGLFLTGDCSAVGNQDKTLTIDLNINYIPDTTCTSGCSMPILCSKQVSVDLHCPGACTEGMFFYDYDIARTSFGSPDNDQDGLADNSGTLDMDEVRDKRAMAGDTLRGTSYGVVKGLLPWSYGYGSSTIELGSNLTALGASIKVYDASSATYLSCNSVSVASSISENDQTFSFDFSPGTLAGSCGDFSSFQFEDGDSVWVYMDYEVTGNIGGSVQEVEINSEFYLSKVANPVLETDKFQCNSWGDKFTLIGYFFNSESKNWVTISGCSKVIQQDFKLSIGDCCSNYQGGNLFPYEYRNWAHVKQGWVVIPENYEVLDIYLKHRRTRYTNASKTQTVNDIQPDSTVGDTLWFNLEQYYVDFGGTIDQSDDGFSGTLYVEIAPTCDVPENTWQDMPWKFTFMESDHLSGTETDWYDTDADKIRFRPPALALSSPNPTIDGIGHTVTWTLKVKNTSSSSGSDNAWIHTKTPSGDFNVDHVIDVASGDTLQMIGDIYQIGEVGAGSTRQFYITASYSSCSPDYIEVYSGYECSAYPTTFADFSCPYSQMELHMEPKPAELQVTVLGNSQSDSCSSEAMVTLELASVQMAHVDSIEITVSMPTDQALTYKSGTAELKYPYSGSFVSLSEPTITNNRFSYQLVNHNNNLNEDGLPGVLQLDANRLQFRFVADINNNFLPGDYIDVSISAKEPCGDTLPTINLAYDPIFKYTRGENSGLSADQGDSWSVSWADYDNDGFEDAYVTEFRHWKGNYLYHNNGDGTFTKITSGPMVNDRGAAAGSTWGDYDNDGDLDLFVSNNVRAVNHLYQNNGDGTFNRVDAGDISNYGGYCHNAAWIDYDNDGYLDMFVSDYMPTKYNQLYHNNGDGTFTKVLDNPIAMEAKFSMGATWADYDNDGLIDLFVPNGRGENNSLYHNEGNGQFIKVLNGDIVNDGGNSVGSSWGDYDNDGDMDLYVTNASDQNNFFYINNGDGTFTRNYTRIIVNEGGHSHGSGWADVDNDGDLDLFVGNDADNSNRLYMNNGDGTFSKTSNPVNEDEENSMGGAFADIDNDGDLDLFVGNKGGQTNTLYLNERGNCNSWKCFKLEGVRSNASAIGAKIRVKATIYGQEVWQTREISSQTGGGSSSQSTIRAYFGLGDATTIDSVVIDWPSGFEQTLTGVYVNDCQDIQEAEGAEICGTVFYDLNQNCVRDSGEVGIPNVMLEVLPGPKYVVTDPDGNYKLYRQYGTYTISPVENEEWTNTNNCDSVRTIVYESANRTASLSFCGNDFAMTPDCSDPDLVAYLSSTALRRGFRNSYAISYLNRGATAVYDMDLTVTFDNDIIPLSADTPWDSVSVGATTTDYFWNVDTLLPMQQYTIMIEDSVSADATLGTMASVTATCTSSEQDCYPDNNIVVDYNEIVGAVDPNDILVFPSGTIMPKDTLTYKIRFQNVGNSYAQRVLIKDSLPEFLDESTLEVQASSHPYRMSLSENRVLSFVFDRIYLPDSVSNEPKSHGFIQFKILPKAETPIGAEIRNRAAIQFDYNEYIITNQTYNKVVNTLQLARENLLKLEINPTPLVDMTYARVVSQHDPSIRVNITSMEVFNMTGIRVYAIPSLNHEEVPIRKENLSSGIYIIRVYDKNGFSHSAKMMVK